MLPVSPASTSEPPPTEHAVRKNQRGRRKDDNAQAIEKTIYINRVAKVVKGGRRFNFTSIVVVGSGDGMVGVGHGKANQVPEAIRKATERARKSMVDVPIVEGTVPHYVIGKFASSLVILRPASPGTGVIAATNVRAILDAAGYRNVLTKVIGSTNTHNVVKATLRALELLESPEQYAVRVGKPLDEVLANYTVGARVWGSLAEA
jgi:small subunit ribosomal protein S5